MVILTDRQTELLDELATLTKEGFPKAKEEWEKSVIAWGTSHDHRFHAYTNSTRREETRKAQGTRG